MTVNFMQIMTRQCSPPLTRRNTRNTRNLLNKITGSFVRRIVARVARISRCEIIGDYLSQNNQRVCNRHHEALCHPITSSSLFHSLSRSSPRYYRYYVSPLLPGARELYHRSLPPPRHAYFRIVALLIRNILLRSVFMIEMLECDS